MCHLFAHDFNCKRRSVGPRVSTSRYQVNIDSSKSKLRPIYKSMPVPTTKMRLYRQQQQQQQSCWQHSTHTHSYTQRTLWGNRNGMDLRKYGWPCCGLCYKGGNSSSGANERYIKDKIYRKLEIFHMTNASVFNIEQTYLSLYTYRYLYILYIRITT